MSKVEQISISQSAMRKSQMSDRTRIMFNISSEMSLDSPTTRHLDTGTNPPQYLQTDGMSDVSVTKPGGLLSP
jgi:hypothetical protein